jgi:raffinose/stachyose/melibiose transport system substrate-binding protein
MARLRTVLGMALAAVLVLAGCGGTDSGTRTLTFFSWDNEENMRPLIERFEQLNPGVTVEFSHAPPVAEYISALQARLLSGTAADVFAIAAENKTNLIDGELVRDLTDAPFMANIAASNKATYSRDGRAYGMSVSSWGGGIFYNRELFARAGITAPPQTWDEFIQVCARLRDAGITPYLEAIPDGSQVVAAFLGAANAASGANLDAQIFDGTSSFGRTWVEPLRQWSRLWDEGLVTRGIVGLKGEQVRDEFVNGRTAMYPSGPWDVQNIRKAAPGLDFEMMPIPALPGGEPYLAGAASPGYAINSAAEEPELAERFLAFLGSVEGVRMFNETTAAITTTTDYEPVIDPSLRPIVESVRGGRYYLPMIAWPRHEDVLQVEAAAQEQMLVQGGTTPQAAAEAMDRRLADSDGNS